VWITTLTAVPTVWGSAADCAIGTAIAIASAAATGTSAFGLFIALILACIVGDHNRLKIPHQKVS
jgi:hypothetical protein